MSTPYFDDAGVTPAAAPAMPSATAPDTTLPLSYGIMVIGVGWAILAIAMLAIGGPVFVGIFQAA